MVVHLIKSLFIVLEKNMADNEEKDYLVEFYNKWLDNPWIVLVSSTNDLIVGGSAKFHPSTGISDEMAKLFNKACRQEHEATLLHAELIAKGQLVNFAFLFASVTL